MVPKESRSKKNGFQLGEKDRLFCKEMKLETYCTEISYRPLRLGVSGIMSGLSARNVKKLNNVSKIHLPKITVFNDERLRGVMKSRRFGKETRWHISKSWAAIDFPL
jgi:hypothetical protein